MKAHAVVLFDTILLVSEKTRETIRQFKSSGAMFRYADKHGWTVTNAESFAR